MSRQSHISTSSKVSQSAGKLNADSNGQQYSSSASTSSDSTKVTDSTELNNLTGQQHSPKCKVVWYDSPPNLLMYNGMSVEDLRIRDESASSFSQVAKKNK